MRKSSQQNVHAATPTTICKKGRKPNVNVQKTTVVDFVALTLLLGQDPWASYENLFSLLGMNDFQIRCTDMYLIRFLVNFIVFCMFSWIT